MRVKNKKLEWYVLNYEWNEHKIVNYNIFGQRFVDELYKKVKSKKINNIQELKEYIDSYCKYYYWSRCEYEILVGDLFGKYPSEFEKIDVYRQIEMNIDRITEYVNNELKIFKG